MTDPAPSPSTFPLTAQQRRALEVPDASVALSAGAGCGKTMVLTERFLAALDDSGGRPLRALVALTFTEKAARELRQRIRARCRAKLAAAEDPSRWWSVLRGLDAAPIGTFHQFCTRLLRRHALRVGIDPEFAVLDESIAGSLRDEAVRSATPAPAGGARRRPHRPGDRLRTPPGPRGARPADVGARLVRPRRVGPARPRDDRRALATTVRRPPLADRPRSRRAVVRHCRQVLEALDTTNAKIQERRLALLDALPLLDPGEAPCPADRLDELVELLRVNDLPRKGSWPSEDAYETARDAIADLRDHIKSQLRPALAWDDAGVRAAAEQSLRFARLARVVGVEHEKLKRRRRGLDFDDLIVMARDLLRDHPEAVLDGPDSIEFVLVDEFQDTDATQGEILRLLGGSGFLSGRLFVVGDVKQSIYRFRGAEPSIFRDWRAEFPPPGRVGLTENFRSVPGVIAFVNALFGDCFDDADPLLPVRREDTGQPTVEFLWPAPRSPTTRRSRRPTIGGCSRPVASPGGSASGSTPAGRSSIGRRTQPGRRTPATSRCCSAP